MRGFGKSAGDHNEHVYPISDGEGTPGNPVAIATDAADETNGPATTADYWGEPEIIIPASTIVKTWNWVGMNLFGTTTNKIIRSQGYKICPTLMTTRNAGNLWDAGETALTVADASLFAIGDLVWVVSDYAQATGQGEFQLITNIVGAVITVAREGSQFGAPNTGIRWNHAGNEKMYLVEREDDLALHGFSFDYSCVSAKDSSRFVWHEHKQMEANCGLVVRSQNATDGTDGTSYDCTAIWGAIG